VRGRQEGKDRGSEGRQEQRKEGIGREGKG